MRDAQNRSVDAQALLIAILVFACGDPQDDDPYAMPRSVTPDADALSSHW